MRIKTQKSTASSLSLKYRNHMFIPYEHDKVRFNFEDKNDWLREGFGLYRLPGNLSLLEF